VIQRSSNHGRSAVRRITFLAVTDGRGNVPLSASRHGSLSGVVAREGVEDAMLQAELLGNEGRVRSVVLDPGPTTLRDLPLLLAARLRAEVLPLATASERQP
jgi:magnesium chelatase subunit D